MSKHFRCHSLQNQKPSLVGLQQRMESKSKLVVNGVGKTYKKRLCTSTLICHHQLNL